MQNSMFPAANIDETLKESFAAFQKDPLRRFQVKVRRTRTAQLRQKLASPEAIDLQTFLHEVWNLESKTYLHNYNRELRIAEKPTLLAPGLEQVLAEKTITLEALEESLTSGNMELHGNYMWRQGTSGYDIRVPKTDQQKLEQIRKALSILNNSDLLPLEKAEQIDAIAGFGEGNATGLVMIFHHDEFALINSVSRGILKKLGVNLTPSTSLQAIQSEMRSLKKEALGASDFLELDLFLYFCDQGEYQLTAIESEIGDKADGTWFQAIKKVLEDAAEPLSVSGIAMRALANGIQTKGKTPERTVSKVLTTSPFVFERISEGVYALKQSKLSPSPQSLPSSKEYIEPSFEQIKQMILNQKMRIDEQTLRRYYLALKTRGFVILSGISGIGKTWLTEAYASAIGAKYCLVPVAPNWTTNEDLLGYVNPLNERQYHHTVFSYFLEDAAQEYEQARDEGRPAIPFHLVLDEMNLARVEYYFATFLSAMEVRARSETASINLGAQKIINIYPNLFFIGTINVDETTHSFADKVYDRAQLIELSASREALKEYIANEPYSDLLMAIWDIIRDVAPFAFRVMDEIKKYIAAGEQLGCTWEEALDEQIVQKILPKCKGADLRIGAVLKALEDILPADTYPLSQAKIQRMIEDFINMDLPLTSKISFLDQVGNNIAGPGEWMEAQVEVHLDNLQNWARISLIRQNAEELPLSLSRFKGQIRALAQWPRSDTGHYRLTLLFDETVLEERIITIQPGKISPDAYKQLLKDLEIYLPASIVLGLQRNAAFSGIKILLPGESTLATELARLNRAVNRNTEQMGLVQVLNELEIDPHKILATTELWVPQEQARRPHPSRLTQAMSRPYNLDKHGTPIRLLDTRVKHSVDVYENRLVKAYVRQVSFRLRRLKRLLENKSAKDLLEEIQRLLALLDSAERNATFLSRVTLPAALPTQSTMVLLKRRAYQAALQGYLEFQKSPGTYITEPKLERPLENLPFLYQVWGTLKVLRVLLEVAGASGYEIKSQRLTERSMDGIFVQLLPDGKPALVLKQPTTGTVIKAIPERTYAKQGKIQSISFSQRPDIAIEIFPRQGSPSVYLFDPKYKLHGEYEGNGKPKKEDIDKMHTYRDALRDSEQKQVVRYAAILYPGPSQNYGHGIEALQAIPGSEISLEEQLKAIFSQALQI